MSPERHPELSIIIPTLNEAVVLPSLLSSLDAQTAQTFEVIIADGGSTDGTLELVRQISPSLSFSLRIVESPRGRANQLNMGAEKACGTFFLFLHADCRFEDKRALNVSLDVLKMAIERAGHGRIAGHFELRFDLMESSKHTAYDFYEAKAALDRPGCTHGDQGFLISRYFWRLVGPFDVMRPVLEDTAFAEKVRRQGQWLLLSARIRTSARRFEVEGLRQRQTLNALIMNFAAIGWDDFFISARNIYRQQDKTAPLRLLPFYQLIRRLLSGLSLGRRFRLWYLTGDYVRSNAWQLAFYFDVRRDRRQGRKPAKTDPVVLNRFDALFTPLTNNLLGRVGAALLVWCWFQWSFVRCMLFDKR